MSYNVPIIITQENNVFYACSPDFTKFNNNEINYYVTYGDNIDEAIENISEVIVLEVSDILDEKQKIPKLSSYDQLQKFIKKNQFITFIKINFEYEIAKVKKVLKNKTVVLPVWLDMLAQQHKLNFSQILQQALKKELKISD